LFKSTNTFTAEGERTKN